MFKVIIISSNIFISVFFSFLFDPSPLTTFYSRHKLSAIKIAISPSILSITLCFTKKIFSNIIISNCKGITSFTMSHAHFPFTLIHISIMPNMFSKSIRLIIKPFTYIVILICSHPLTESLLFPFNPLAFIPFPCDPFVSAFSLNFAFMILSNISVASLKFFVP